MRKVVTIICVLLGCSTGSFAQRRCGIEAEKAALIAKDPSWAQKLEKQRASLQGIADNYQKRQAAKSAERTTAVSAIPVIFHIIITNAQLNQLGGISGIEARVSSQMDVLNEDFNKANPDGSLIPSGWTSLYASVGVHFGLAHTRPDAWGTEGFELKIIPTASGGFFQGANASYADAKHASSGGLDAWDNTKYLNVWCTNFSDDSLLLGTTVPISFSTSSGYPLNEVGVAMNYLSLGRRGSSSDIYIASGWSTDYYDKGRTLTHEIGHLFEIWHTWGDDFGQCEGFGGQDDGLADTPPEANHKFYNYADTIPGGTYYDACKDSAGVNVQPYGIASLDYMNYTDDIAMHLFTTQQAAAMAAMVLQVPGAGTGADGQGTTGESYSLTQHPELLQWPAGVQQININNSLNISPNPTTGTINVTYNSQADELNGISVLNILGQEVLTINTPGALKDVYSIDLSGMSKGIYFVRCNFASGIITRKILLQ